jgi:Tfp pilus assembly protein PilF
LDDEVLPGELADINFSGDATSDFFGGGGDVVVSGDRFHGTAKLVRFSKHATQSDAESLAWAAVAYGNPRIAREVALGAEQKWNRPEFPHLVNAAILVRDGDVVAAEEEFRNAVAQRETAETLNALADFLLGQKENQAVRATEATVLLERVASVDRGESGRAALKRIFVQRLAEPGRIPALLSKFRSLAGNDPQELLFADAIELDCFPANRGRVLDGVVARALNAPPAERIVAVRWLLSKNDAARAAQALPVRDAVGNADAFETAVETLFALEKWDGAVGALRAPSNPLEPHRTAALLASAASLQGDKQSRERWIAVLDQNKGDPGKTLFLLQKAGAAGQWDVVYERFPSLLNEPAWALQSFSLLADTARGNGDAEALLELHALALNSRMLGGDPAVRDRAAFDRLIAGQEVPEDELEERSEAFRENSSMRVTRALGLLAEGSRMRALYELEEVQPRIDVEKLAPAQQAVFAAVLSASGRVSEAEKIAGAIPEWALMPQEREFLGRHLNPAAKAD